ncbi:MAG: cytochrome P450 [Acidimicrobiales bacterium]
MNTLPSDNRLSSNKPRPGTELAARLTDPELYSNDPYPLYKRLRAEAPMAWNEERGFWAVSRHADVVTAESDAQTYCASRGILVEEIGVNYESPPTILHTDPPAHTRYRRLVQPGFRPTVTRALEPIVRARATRLIDQIEPGKPVDIVQALSVPFPLLVISEILGVGEADWRRCYEWSGAVIPGATDWPQERRDQLMGEMVMFLLNATKKRRSNPTDDVLSELANVTIDGDNLTDDELAMFLVQLLVAGNETTRNMLSAGLVALADAPEQWERLRTDSDVMKTATEELLRFTSPVIYFMRTATRDAVLGGQEIKSVEPLVLLFASADRDEEVFGQNSEELDVGRDPNPHVAFGFGNHFCLGATLARLEGRVVLEELSSRFSSIERAGVVERSPSPVIAGTRRAELCFRS